MTETATGALMVRGTTLIDVCINGVFQGLKEVPGVVEFAVTPKSKTVTQVSKDKATAGQVTASVTLPEPTELKIKFSAFNALMMAIALTGESSVLEVGAGTATAVPIVAKLGCFVEVGTENLTEGSVVVTNSAGSTTYTLGTDYAVNYALGLIQAKPTGAITGGQALKVNHASAARTGFITRGATTPSFKARILIDGINMADGDTVKIEIDMAELAAGSPVDFMSDKFSELELTGFMITQPGKTDPYRMEKYKSA